MTHDVLLLIPLYNEESTIAKVLLRTRLYFSGDILVINDGSTDDSVRNVSKLKDGRVVVLDHFCNEGYGKSLIDGFHYAQSNAYDIVLTMDCDDQHEPAKIPDFIRQLYDCDVVSGSRYLVDDHSNDHPPEDRLNINLQITQRLNTLLPFRITDAFCGFKAYRVSVISRLDLKEPGYAFPLQVWMQLGRLNAAVKEVAVPRIYQNLTRTFGKDLDDPLRRLAYYNIIIDEELKNGRRYYGHRGTS